MKIFTYIKDNSSRIPKKNFKKIGELELWKHLLYEFSEFDTFVDTDSPEVLRECSADTRLSNIVCYERDERFIEMENDASNMLSPSLLMVENFLDNYVLDADEPIVLTHVTSPFLKSETVLDALSFLKKGYDSIHSIYTVQDFAWLGESHVPLNFNPSVVERTQDVEKVHFSNGAFFIFTKNTFKKFNNRFGEKVYYYNLDRVQSIEIDNTEDLKLARTVFAGINLNGEKR